MKKPILLAITAYQRHISPYKGFHCAFHAHTGRQTCSGYGYRVFARYGTLKGWQLLRRRLADCSTAAQIRYRQVERVKPTPLSRQAGFIDCAGCDLPGCDLPALDILDCGCNLLDLLNCGDGKRRSWREWECGDWLIFLVVLAIIGAVIFAATHRHFF